MPSAISHYSHLNHQASKSRSEQDDNFVTKAPNEFAKRDDGKCSFWCFHVIIEQTALSHFD